jgi:hypothetical protein
MNLKTAITILKCHNKWRRGESDKIENPKNIGIAIDVVISEFEENNKIQLPTNKEFWENWNKHKDPTKMWLWLQRLK